MCLICPCLLVHVNIDNDTFMMEWNWFYDDTVVRCITLNYATIMST